MAVTGETMKELGRKTFPQRGTWFIWLHGGERLRAYIGLEPTQPQKTLMLGGYTRDELTQLASLLIKAAESVPGEKEERDN